MYEAAPQATRTTSVPKPLPAPVGGWNARDPMTNMSLKDAIQLDNFFPRARSVDTRPGSVLLATLPTDTEPSDPHNVRSLMSYNASNGVSTLFAGCEDGIYDVTAGGTISTISSAATNGEWQHTMLSNAAGTFLWMCNGVDNARYWNGTAWTVLTAVSTPAITGLATEDITNVSLFKTRLMLCEKDSLSFWYLDVNSVAGTITEFPLGALFSEGGYLVATGSWTIDGGSGTDDYFVAVTSKGEVAIYQGTNPASASTWALIGVFYVGTPLGKRCLVKYGGDLLLLTVQGLQPLSKVLDSATIDRQHAVSDKISGAFSEAVNISADMFGWQIIIYPEAPFLLVNAPLISEQADGVVFSYQFVMNTQTKAWCRFAGMSAEVWAVSGGNLYFALHNKIYQAWTGTVDESYGPIDARARQAFFTPAGGRNTHVTMIRPLFQASAKDIAVQLGIDTDYETANVAYSTVSYIASLALYDTAIWDESRWAGSLFNGQWRSVSHNPGHALSVRLRFLGRGVTLSWNATDLTLQSGGVFG